PSSTAWGDLAQTMAANNLANYHPPQIDVASIAGTPPGYLAHGPLPTPPSSGGTGGTGSTGGAGGTGGTGGFGSKTGFTVDASGNIIDAAGNIVGSTGSFLGAGASGPGGAVTMSAGGGNSNFGNVVDPAMAAKAQALGVQAFKRGGAIERAMRVARKAFGGRAHKDDGGSTGKGGIGSDLVAGNLGEVQAETYPFSQFLKDIHNQVGPPIPHWPSSREEALEQIGEPATLGEFAKQGAKYAAQTVAPPLVGKGLAPLPKAASIPAL